MEKYYQVINICSDVDRKDLIEFLEDLLSRIKPNLEEIDDPDYSSDSESEPDDDPVDPMDETKYKVHIDEDGFWSFVFSDDE
jgi:hypothetical protein